MTANTLDTLAVATGLLGEPLEPVGQPLPTSARNRVVRARRPDGSTLVVKHYLDSTHDGRWRVLCALKALHGADAAVPVVIAANDDLVVMEDLGDRPHLAAAMLADDPADAWHWLSANWLLDRLIGDQYGQRPDRPSPRAQDRIARSLDRVAHSEILPEIAGAATTLLAGLAARSDVEPLPVMPAFR